MSGDNPKKRAPIVTFQEPSTKEFDKDESGSVHPSSEEEQTIRRMSRRALLQMGLVIAGGVGGLVAFNKRAPERDGTKAALRNVLSFNELVARNLFFSSTHRAKEFPRSAAMQPRNNYKGETPEVDLAAWTLKLEGEQGNNEPRTLTMADIKQLPEVSQTTELKCIEGWSTVVHWTGVRFMDFIKKFPPPPDTRYVALLSEPEGWDDEWYYVGLDMESAMHPQALLAYEMNNEPLTSEHGAPLRLAIPHKYGIKNIKLITRIAYTNTRPKDYWAELGYDWYAGL